MIRLTPPPIMEKNIDASALIHYLKKHVEELQIVLNMITEKITEVEKNTSNTKKGDGNV